MCVWKRITERRSGSTAKSTSPAGERTASSHQAPPKAEARLLIT